MKDDIKLEPKALEAALHEFRQWAPDAQGRKALEASITAYLTALVPSPPAGEAGDVVKLAYDCDAWPAWLGNIVDEAIAACDKYDGSTEQCIAHGVLLALASPAKASAEDSGVMRRSLELHQLWLRSALDCKDWSWDGDQRQAAEEAYAEGLSILNSLPSTEREPSDEQVEAAAQSLWPHAWAEGSEIDRDVARFSARAALSSAFAVAPTQPEKERGNG